MLSVQLIPGVLADIQPIQGLAVRAEYKRSILQIRPLSFYGPHEGQALLLIAVIP